MKKILFVTIFNDHLIPFLLTDYVKKIINADFLFLEESPAIISRRLKQNQYDYIYIRDPFPSDKNKKEISQKLDLIFRNKKKSYTIDNLQNTKDVFFEDKWEEYKKLRKFMPETRLLKKDEKIDFNKFIVKKRLSSRARGIFLENKKNLNIDNCIIQEKMDIKKEYRIYTIFNEIIKLAGIKSSKTINTKVQFVSSENISKKLYDFVLQIKNHLKFDFIGFDIALLKNGQLKLIEVNRSPLITGYYRVTGINLAERFIDKLLNVKQHK